MGQQPRYRVFRVILIDLNTTSLQRSVLLLGTRYCIIITTHPASNVRETFLKRCCCNVKRCNNILYWLFCHFIYVVTTLFLTF